MKIGLVCPYNMFERAGGVHQVIMHLKDGLVAKGHSVKIITPKPNGFKGEIPEDTILLGTTTPFSPGLGTSGTWTYDISSKEVKAILEKEKFDVINFHEPWTPILARQILPYSKAAHVGTFHANLMDSRAAKSIVNLFLPYGRGIGEKLHLITAVSQAPASLLLNKDPNHKLVKNIKYIPNGIDLKTYKPPKKRVALNGTGTKTIVYVGRLEKRKGVDWLIKAFGLLVKEMPHTYLVIAGDGGWRSRLEQLVESSEIPNVNFLGYITDEQKRNLMGNADVVCAPSPFGESFGIVLLEAMATGAPLIAGRNMGYMNVMTGRGRLGLVDVEATEDFASRLAVFLSEELVSRQARDWGLRDVKKYDYPKIIDQYEAAYKEALRILNEPENSKQMEKTDEKNPGKIIRRLFIRRQSG